MLLLLVKLCFEITVEDVYRALMNQMVNDAFFDSVYRLITHENSGSFFEQAFLVAQHENRLSI
ncbi:hypothetical protein [Acinetobacter seifertii]|uniref:hypothetical protein n=1 Tax=Acinetobacter seifertii TaxID=1530123 RepID=UPI003F72B34B